LRLNQARRLGRVRFFDNQRRSGQFRQSAHILAGLHQKQCTMRSAITDTAPRMSAMAIGCSELEFQLQRSRHAFPFPQIALHRMEYQRAF
jgi:hypothetical protein